MTDIIFRQNKRSHTNERHGQADLFTVASDSLHVISPLHVSENIQIRQDKYDDCLEKKAIVERMFF